MKRFTRITSIVVITLMTLASCNDGRHTSPALGELIQKSPHAAKHTIQNRAKQTPTTTILKETNGTSNAQTQPITKKNKALSRWHHFHHRTVSKLFAHNMTDSLSVGHAELRVPQGSMDRSKILSVTPLVKDELPTLPAGMVNVTGDRNASVSVSLKNGVAGYRLLPHGEHFVHKPATITVPYDSTLIPEGYTANDIHTYYYDELQGKWTMLRHKALDKVQKVVTAETSHFTDVINGIIKVPESPETQNYVPTGIAELKAADPAAGIATVSAPTPNQNGTASLGYTFELPKGRAGMQPSVGLQYSSDGGSSYAGYGWSLPVQSVDIETRWGVPRFDPNNESESYLLMGTKLGDRTYRKTEPTARKPNKRFYPLVEGSFARIIRKGDSPTNYTWEVTSKDGITSYFGGIDGKSVDNAVIKDGEGNIVRWALYRTVDSHGNFVSYTYEHRDSTLYPKSYRYTGHADNEGPYAVNFKYISGTRKDAVRSGRLRILQTDNALLQRVEVSFNNEPIRSFTLHHHEGPFAKTLLDSIVQNDAKGERVAAQGFEYYNDVKDGMFSKTPLEYTAEQDYYGNLVKTHFGHFDESLSLLGGGSAKGNTLGGGVMVGGGWGPASGGAGPSFSYSKTENKAHVTLVDINGDGMPDKVFKDGDGNIYYRPNLNRDLAHPLFGEAKRILGISSFTEGSVTSNTWSINFSTGIGPISTGASYSRTTERSRNKTYFHDFNADGLIDIAHNGVVHFNHSDGSTVTFSPTSGGTHNPIGGGTTNLDSTFIPDRKTIREQMEREHPLHDIVRLWRAPYKGTVKIKGTVVKPSPKGDGVSLSIQHNDYVLWRDTLLQSGQVTIPEKSLHVWPGDYLLFRVSAKNSGEGDAVDWDPEIIYTHTKFKTYAGTDITHYRHSKDAISGEAPTAPLSVNGEVHYSGRFSKLKTSDDITLCVIRTDSTGKQTVIASKHLPADTVASGKFEGSFQSVAKACQTVSFIARANSPIDWQALKWAPIFHTDTTEYIIAPQRTMYNKVVAVAIDTLVSLPPSDSTWGDRFVLVPNLRVTRESDKDTDTATVYLTLKDNHGTLIYHRKLKMERMNVLSKDGDIIDGNHLLTKLSTGKVQACFSVLNELNFAHVAELQILRDSILYEKDKLGKKHEVGRRPVHVATIDASVHSSFNRLDYGTLYRGWGQFAWNGNNTEAINPSEMRAPDATSLGTDQEGASEFVKNGSFDANSQKFFTLAYVAKTNKYVTATDSAYVSGITMRPSRLGTDEIVLDVPNYDSSGEGLPAPVQETVSVTTGTTISAGVSLGASAGVNQSESSQESTTTVSVTDINGDGYPDWMRGWASAKENKITVMFTQQTGMIGRVQKYGAPLPSSNGNSSNSGQDVGLSFNPSAYNISKFKEQTDAAKAAVAKCNASLILTGRLDCNAGGASFSSNISEASCGASGNFSNGTTMSTIDWTDLNGDGLPDVLTDGLVSYGLGYSLAPAVPAGTNKMTNALNNNYGDGKGVCIPVRGPFSISGGQNDTESLTMGMGAFHDVNGDGLPDFVERDLKGNLNVSFNTGVGFMPDVKMKDKSEMSSDLGSSVALYASTAYTIRIPLPFGFVITITPSTQGSHSESVNRTRTAMLDIDGDGLPDIVFSDNENSLKAYRNLTGRTNLLRSVTLPFGGHVRVEYQQTMPSFAMPGRRWVMSAVETSGGYAENGATRMRNEFAYEGGYRDRRERDFFGFAKVITRQLDTQNNNAVYRTQVSEYGHNRNLYMHDLVTAETLYDAAGNKLQGTLNTYEAVRQRDDSTSVFPALVSIRQTVYDNAEQGSMSTTVHNTYDAYGNLASYKEAATNYELHADIAYHELRESHIVALPRHIVVKDNAGRVYRERSTEVDGKGNITRITMHNGQLSSVYDMAYDAYGNLTSLTKPENHKGQRMRYEYTYDGVLHQLVTGVKDAYGYTSSTDYDYRWSAPLETRDINGNRMHYAYDDMGRPSTIVGPKEIAAGKPYTIKFEYHPTGRYARTMHYASEGDIETYTFADSLMRAVQTKRTGVVWKGGSAHKVSIVSGRMVQDAFGRTLKAYWPTEEAFGSMGLYNKGVGDLQAVTEYDAYDRSTKVTLPDGATTTTAYAIVSHDGEPMLETRVTDALGRHAESYTDEKGRNRETVQHAASGDVRVKYDYDAVGQVITVHHPNGKTTAYEYDLLGHKLRVNHPDAGEVTCTYDAAGNLLTKLTAELKKTISDKASITYTYDYERLSEVLYPKNLFNRVTYTYGKPGAKYNRAGRLVLVEDASGGEAYYYGNQGEVVKTVRSVMVSQADVRTYVHAATYDSHNRVRTITYPDGEVVTYGYDAAGQVTSIRSTKQGKEETIVAQVGYDKDGHTIYTRMGNGTESTYAYDRQRERLQGMLLTANGDSIMQTQYKYDPVDNILGISNVITPKAPKKPKGFGGFGSMDGMGGPDAGKEKKEKPLGGAFSHTYAYDELNRLVRAEGKAKGLGYAMDMSFGLMGEPLTKVQRTDSGSVAGSYALAYKYGDADHPTAPSQIGHERYTYDANGNPTLVEDDSLNTERRMAWDEENRLMVLSDNGKTSRYTYNAAGERIVKSHGYLEGVYVNGAPQGLTFHETEDYTIYPAPILSVTRQRFTKHYFIGDRRVASKIGAGIFQNAYGHGANVVTAGQKDYQMRMMQIEKQREDYYRKLGTPPGVPTMKGATAEPENTHEGYNTIIKELGDHSVPDGWIQRPKRNAVPGTPPGPPVQWDKAEDPDDVQPGYGYVPADTAREDIFFYHTDHLGSTSYITDAKANVAQFDAYLPYGELLVDEHSSTEEMPYKFNGKELDEETGLYYYGARYMNPKTSLWYGVDPHIEEMAFSSSYSYCDDHPVNFVDIKGKKKLNWIVLTLKDFPESDPRNISAYYRSNYDDNVVNIWAHGLRDSEPGNIQHAWGLGVSKRNSGELWMNVAFSIPKDILLFSERIDGEDRGWRERNNGHPILVLHCCASSTFAQQISTAKEFKDVIIIAPDATLQSDKKKGERINSIVSGKHYEYKRNGLWHVYMNGKPLKDKNGKAILYNYNAQPGTKGFDYKLNLKKQRKK